MRSQDKRTYVIAVSGVCLALALALSYLEYLIPLNLLIPLPYVKLGLANAVVLYLMYRHTSAQAFTVSILRVCLSALLFSSVTGFLFSLLGALLSFAAARLMMPLYGRVSFVGISMVSAACHNIGQIIAACLMFASFGPVMYLPVLLIASTFTGAITGLIIMLSERNLGVKA